MLPNQIVEWLEINGSGQKFWSEVIKNDFNIKSNYL